MNKKRLAHKLTWNKFGNCAVERLEQQAHNVGWQLDATFDERSRNCVQAHISRVLDAGDVLTLLLPHLLSAE